MHRATLSPFLRGIWDDSRGPGASGGETNANTVHIVCRCVVIRGGAPKEWGRRRSHDMSGMVTVILFFFFFFPPSSLQSHDRLMYNCPCLRTLQADSYDMQAGHKGPCD